MTCLQTEGLLTTVSCWPRIRKQVCYTISFIVPIRPLPSVYMVSTLLGTSSSLQDFIVCESSMGEFATGFQPLLWVSYWLVSTATEVHGFHSTFLPLDLQCVAQRTVEVVLELVVKKVLEAKPHIFNRSNSIMFMFFFEGVLVFTKLRRTQNNYGAQRQK